MWLEGQISHQLHNICFPVFIYSVVRFRSNGTPLSNPSLAPMYYLNMRSTINQILISKRGQTQPLPPPLHSKHTLYALTLSLSLLLSLSHTHLKHMHTSFESAREMDRDKEKRYMLEKPIPPLTHACTDPPLSLEPVFLPSQLLCPITRPRRALQ